MFFRNCEVRFSEISWPEIEHYGKSQYKKEMQSTKRSARSVRISFILFNVTDPLITPLSFIFLSCCEKSHNTKNSVVKI